MKSVSSQGKPVMFCKASGQHNPCFMLQAGSPELNDNDTVHTAATCVEHICKEKSIICLHASGIYQMLHSDQPTQ